MIYDIYDENHMLVKANIQLNKNGNHKDLINNRYIKMRIGTTIQKYDYMGLLNRIKQLEQQVQELYKQLF